MVGAGPVGRTDPVGGADRAGGGFRPAGAAIRSRPARPARGAPPPLRRSRGRARTRTGQWTPARAGACACEAQGAQRGPLGEQARTGERPGCCRRFVRPRTRRWTGPHARLRARRRAGPHARLRASVQGDVGRDVAGTVRHRCGLAPLPEAGECSERGARVRRVRVVHRHREPARDAGDGGRPRRVPGQPDLRPQPLLTRRRPPSREPLRLRAGHPLPEPLGPGVPDEHQSRHPRRVDLRDLYGHVVQPLVGEEQPGDPAWRRGQPLDPASKARRAVGDFDAARACACRHIGGERRQHSGDQFTPPGGHVDEVERRGRPSASSTRHSSRATASANSADACTDVRKCPAGPSDRR